MAIFALFNYGLNLIVVFVFLLAWGVDIVMQLATFDPEQTKAARAAVRLPG